MSPGLSELIVHIAAEDWYISIGFAVLCGLVWGLWPRRHPDERRRWTYAWVLGVLSFGPLYLLLALAAASIQSRMAGSSWETALGFIREMRGSDSLTTWLAFAYLLGTLFHAVVSLLPVMLSFEAAWWLRRRWDTKRERVGQEEE